MLAKECLTLFQSVKEAMFGKGLLAKLNKVFVNQRNVSEALTSPLVMSALKEDVSMTCYNDITRGDVRSFVTPFSLLDVSDVKSVRKFQDQQDVRCPNKPSVCH